MAEGLVMQVGSSVYKQSTNHNEAQNSLLNRGAGLQEECGSVTSSGYCKDLLMRGGEEFSFEELRAEIYFKCRDREMDEKLNHLKQLKEHLTQELEDKNRLLLLRRTQQQVLHEASRSQSSDPATPPTAASFQIYDESQTQPPAAAQPDGKAEPSPNELLDDVFLRPDERGLCLKVQCPRPGGVPSSELSQSQSQSGPSSASTGHHRGTTEDLQTLVHSRPPSLPQKPFSKVPENLSPIEETSVEASSLTSLGVLSPETCSPLENPDKEIIDQASSAGGATDPCEPAVRRQLLDLCDVTSCPDLHPEPGPLPPVEENSCLQLGGEVYLIFSRVVDGGSFSVYKGVMEDEFVLIKVDSCSVPWDFHQFTRLKKSSSRADGLPLISCFLFVDGCITVYTPPPDHMFTELAEGDPSELSVGHKAVSLLQLVSQLHSCRLVHAALQPHVLTCSRRGFLSPYWVFPVDWSSSVDLDLQQVRSVQQLPSAQTYISVGLLELTTPPQLVDLVGVAETIHLLLTNSKMVLVKDNSGWSAETFSGQEPCDKFSRMWREFFQALLNADGHSSQSVLLELQEQLLTLYH